MSNINPGREPPLVEGMDAVPITRLFGERAGGPRERRTGDRPLRRIDGKFCPFCGGRIPEEFVFCTNCGRDV